MAKLLKPQGGKVTVEIARDAYLLAGEELTDPEDLTQEQLDQAYDWAIRVHLKAAGNRTRIPGRPIFA